MPFDHRPEAYRIPYLPRFHRPQPPDFQWIGYERPVDITSGLRFRNPHVPRRFRGNRLNYPNQSWLFFPAPDSGL